MHYLQRFAELYISMKYNNSIFKNFKSLSDKDFCLSYMERFFKTQNSFKRWRYILSILKITNLNFLRQWISSPKNENILNQLFWKITATYIRFFFSTSIKFILEFFNPINKVYWDTKYEKFQTHVQNFIVIFCNSSINLNSICGKTDLI